MAMEKPSYVGNGVLRLPPGFRFHPTDEELVVQYLRRKVFSCPLPASIIPEIDLGKYNPWDLPGSSTEERYFFNLKEAKYMNGSRTNRATSAGYWKATGKDKAVVVSRCNHVVGMKKVLVFYQGKPPNGSRTNWIMHEYRLILSNAQPRPSCNNTSPKTNISPTHNTGVPMRDWVLCRIFKKKIDAQMDSGEAEQEEDDAGGIRFFDFMRQYGHTTPPSSSSSSDSSSCVTDLSDGSSSSTGEETSSTS